MCSEGSLQSNHTVAGVIRHVIMVPYYTFQFLKYTSNQSCNYLGLNSTWGGCREWKRNMGTTADMSMTDRLFLSHVPDCLSQRCRKGVKLLAEENKPLSCKTWEFTAAAQVPKYVVSLHGPVIRDPSTPITTPSSTTFKTGPHSSYPFTKDRSPTGGPSRNWALNGFCRPKGLRVHDMWALKGLPYPHFGVYVHTIQLVE